MTTTHRFGMTVLTLAFLAALGLAGPARAAYVVNMIESGGDVVATGSGTLDLTDLDGDQYSSGDRFIRPDGAWVSLGALGSGQGGMFRGISGPSSFGPGNTSYATSGTGDIAGLEEDGGVLQVTVPLGYVSGSQLNSSDTWSGATFTSLGLTPGTYVWTWGSGTDADSFTMNIGTQPVPEPASLVMLSLGTAGTLGYARRRRTSSRSI